jgi:hypothetical protein
LVTVFQLRVVEVTIVHRLHDRGTPKFQVILARAQADPACRTAVEVSDQARCPLDQVTQGLPVPLAGRRALWRLGSQGQRPRLERSERHAGSS